MLKSGAVTPFYELISLECLGSVFTQNNGMELNVCEANDRKACQVAVLIHCQNRNGKG
jgi:hypothetical protein